MKPNKINQKGSGALNQNVYLLKPTNSAIPLAILKCSHALTSWTFAEKKRKKINNSLDQVVIQSKNVQLV